MKNSKAFGKPDIVTVEDFEFLKFGSLRQFEMSWFNTESNKRLASLIPIQKLAQKIALEMDIPEVEALGLVQGAGDRSKYQTMLLNYATDLLEINSKAYSETDFNCAVCSMIIKSRVPKSWLVENLTEFSEYYGFELVDDSDKWFDSYTSYLPETIISSVIEFTEGERRRWVELEPVDESVTVELGK